MEFLQIPANITVKLSISKLPSLSLVGQAFNTMIKHCKKFDSDFPDENHVLNKSVQKMRPVLMDYDEHLHREPHLIATFFDVGLKKKQGPELNAQIKVSL